MPDPDLSQLDPSLAGLDKRHPCAFCGTPYSEPVEARACEERCGIVQMSKPACEVCGKRYNTEREARHCTDENCYW